MNVSRSDNNLATALRSLETTKDELMGMVTRAAGSQAETGKLVKAMAHLAFAEGILFAETSLSGDDWRNLISELET